MEGCVKITTDDLLEALQDALSKPSDGEASTVSDIMDATGRSSALVRKSLQVLAREGRLEVVQVRRPSLDGRLVPVPGYRIKPKAA